MKSPVGDDEVKDEKGKPVIRWAFQTDTRFLIQSQPVYPRLCTWKNWWLDAHDQRVHRQSTLNLPSELAAHPLQGRTTNPLHIPFGARQIDNAFQRAHRQIPIRKEHV